MRIIYSLLLCLSAASPLWAQESDTLTTRYKVLSKGNITITGNNILNRKEGKADANTPYNDLIGGLKLNDSQVMEYLDVDKDKKTFSSSAASVFLPKNSKILFAGLYWAATYPYEQGQVVAKKSVAKDAKRESVEEVLLKVPKGKYTPVKGEYVFDGNTDSRYMGKNAPYVMFADVTKLVQSNKHIDGEYTVANVRAARGSVEGGSCAGWSLVIAYENASEPFRKLDIKDGFLEVKGNKNIAFTNYKIPSVKEAFPRLVGAVLDADFNQGENKVGVFSDKVGFYLETKTRKIKNFFNSSITYGEDYLKQRNPNSKNTLGFDIFSVELPNYDFEVFPIGNDYLRVSFSSTRDSYYAFLMGLAINTEESTSLRDEEVDRLLGKKTTPKPAPTGQTIVNANQTTTGGVKTNQQANATSQNTTAQTSTTAQANATTQAKPPIQQAPAGQTATTAQASQAAQTGQAEQIPDSVRRITAANVKKGFYLVLGAYSSKENAEKYMFGLRQKGMRAEGSFFYAEKNLYYAYSLYTTTYAEAFKKQQEINTTRSLNPDLQKVKDVWILYVE